MNTDSGVNVVVFEVRVGRRLEKLMGEGPTRAADGIRRVWVQLAAAAGVRPADVRRVYAQWEPTPDDRTFIAAEFPPRSRTSYSFRRPAARRDWGRGTPEFGRAVDEFRRAFEEFERAASTAGVSAVEGPRRPWWRYWDWPGEGTNPLTGVRP